LFIYLSVIASMKVWGFFGVLTYLIADGLILLFVALVELLGLVYTFFTIYGSFVVCAYLVGY
jgi:hypothetical protein